MMLQKLPDTFYSENQLKEMMTSWSKSSSLLSFQRLIPFFFDQLVQLDSPTDVWFVRDIVYNSSEEIIKKDEMLARLASVLSDDFMRDVYSELEGKNTALEFTKSMYAIDAEIRCAALIKKAGADNITKRTTPEDVSCTYNGFRLGFQVKFKSDEDFTSDVVDQAIIGEMYKNNSDILRDYSHFSVQRCTKAKEGFLADSIRYFHSHLSLHLQLTSGSHSTENMTANVTQHDSMLYLDIVGGGKYKGSTLSITFRQNPSRMLSSAKVARMDQEPEEQLWILLEKKIKEIPPNPCLVGWIDLEMSFQYESYLSIESNRAKIATFLEKHSIPLVLRVKVKFKPDTILSNKAAMEFPLITKLVSS